MINSSFTGETKIFRKDDKGFPTYSTSFGKKNTEGTYDNAYMEVRLKKGVEIENGTVINIVKSFLTFRQYENKDGKKVTIWQIMVLDFDTEYMDTPSEPSIEDNFAAINEDVPW